MKFTTILAVVAGLFAASAAAHEQWVYNDHRRPRTVDKTNDYVPTAEDKSLCARWDGPRCLDDEEGPNIFDEEERKRQELQSPKEKREEALAELEKIQKVWEGYHAEMRNLKMMEKIYEGFNEQLDRLEKMAKLKIGRNREADEV
ncbi:hypothetical protein J4E83_009896 [Alternaria metachromatica]|uniref:uncharacterized protein n=1 Tax=Alternaria metachromatica TaxID=283354 RepID=UPI0020C3C474|nr:uncharacterized protein J4E83_009896 [Alternaria metachromatica]KAI4606751.1 hypothetical protein J4E83_009896 [Alternaria metachromatica]